MKAEDVIVKYRMEIINVTEHKNICPTRIKYKLHYHKVAISQHARAEIFISFLIESQKINIKSVRSIVIK